MKKQNKALVLSALAALAFGAGAVGTTFALFTSQAEANVTVTTGKVDVEAAISGLKTYSMDVEQTEGEFELGGSAVIDGTTLKLDKVTPGDKVVFQLGATNNSTVNVKYRFGFEEGKGLALFSMLEMKVADTESDLATATAVGEYKSDWAALEVGETPEAKFVSIELPKNVTSVAQNLTCEIILSVEAVQGNAEVLNDLYTLPEGITEESFANAEKVYFYSAWGWKDTGEKASAYYNGKFYDGLGNAIYAARENTEGENETIYMRPNFTSESKDYWGNVAENLTVYGNGATVGGKDRLAIESSDTAPLFTSDITLNLFDLNNVEVWGDRRTEYALNVKAENCEFTRIYLTNGGTIDGKVNLDLDKCKFIGEEQNETLNNGEYFNTTIYSNYNGTIDLYDCMFQNMAVGLNLNHKIAGTQTINIADTAFIDCSTDEVNTENEYLYFAPIRMYEKAEGAIASLTVKDTVFNYSTGKDAINGYDILLNKVHKGTEAKGSITYSAPEDAEVYEGVNVTAAA